MASKTSASGHGLLHAEEIGLLWLSMLPLVPPTEVRELPLSENHVDESLLAVEQEVLW